MTDAAHDLMEHAVRNAAHYLARYQDSPDQKLIARIKSVIRRQAKQVARKRNREISYGALTELEHLIMVMPEDEQRAIANELFSRLPPFAQSVLNRRWMGIHVAGDRSRFGTGSHCRSSCIFSGVRIAAAQHLSVWRISSMNLLRRGSSRAEGRLEDWVKQRYQERVLSGQTQPLGSCPDEAFLRALAKRSKAIPLSDTRVDHAATCPNCMSRLLAFSQEYQSRERKLAFTIIGAACLVLIAALITWLRYESHRQATLAVAPPISKTVDLWNSGTYRGEQAGQLQSVILPAARVQLTIILPRFSTAGRYLVAVTRGQSGNGVVAEGAASAVASGNQEIISVDLDLRSIKSGAYFLSTTHEQDQAAYYYPLQIK